MHARRLKSSQEYQELRLGPALVAIGNFDGVHRGHQTVLEAAALRALDQGLTPTVLTFDPHPSVVLGRPEQPVLTSLSRKVELICQVHDALRVVVEPFTAELARLSPRTFAQELLSARLCARELIVGSNFRFGHARSGDLGTLKELGTELGFAARAEPLFSDAAGPISSSRIRDRIANGDLEAAEGLLGRPHSLSGTVARGDGRGRTLGFPTANLAGVIEQLPSHGVYACVVDELDEHETATALGQGVANIGVRPTFGAGASVELHLFDFHGDLYDRQLRIHLVKMLRAERRFSDVSQLVTQIQQDIEQARIIVVERKRQGLRAWY